MAFISFSHLERDWGTKKEMIIHSSILAWRIPWIEEPGRIQSMGLQRVGHDWLTNTFTGNKDKMGERRKNLKSQRVDSLVNLQLGVRVLEMKLEAPVWGGQHSHLHKGWEDQQGARSCSCQGESGLDPQRCPLCPWELLYPVLCDTMIYNKKYLFGLCPHPGTQLLKPCSFLAMRPWKLLALSHSSLSHLFHLSVPELYPFIVKW